MGTEARERMKCGKLRARGALWTQSGRCQERPHSYAGLCALCSCPINRYQEIKLKRSSRLSSSTGHTSAQSSHGNSLWGPFQSWAPLTPSSGHNKSANTWGKMGQGHFPCPVLLGLHLLIFTTALSSHLILPLPQSPFTL